MYVWINDRDMNDLDLIGGFCGDNNGRFTKLLLTLTKTHTSPSLPQTRRQTDYTLPQEIHKSHFIGQVPEEQ